MMGKKDYGERIYYNVSLEKLVPPDDYYRRVEEAIDFSFIRPLCRHLYGHKGQVSIDPEVFFKAELIGFLEDIISDRRLVRVISDRLSLRRFVKYDIDEDFVWHSTISRTRQLIPERLYREVFEKILRSCVEAELVEGEHIVVDTALIKANASMESLEKKRPGFSVVEYRERAMRENPDKDEEKGIEKPEKEKKKKFDNAEWESRSDPDARVATKPGKPVALYYKDAIAVDPKKNIVVGVEGVRADVADQRTLEPVVDRAIENLDDLGFEPQNVIGDSGFYSGENLETMEKKGLEPFFPEQGHGVHDTKFGIEDFKHNPEKDEYICPNGQTLGFKGMKTTRGKKSRKYACGAGVCARCGLRDKCTDAKGGRVLSVSMHRKQYEKHRKRMTRYVRRRMERLRRGSVEPVFGEAINYCGLRRINTRGIEGANKKFIMCAAAQNLKKLIKYGAKPLLVAEARIKMTAIKMRGGALKIFAPFFGQQIHPAFANTFSHLLSRNSKT